MLDLLNTLYEHQPPGFAMLQHQNITELKSNPVEQLANIIRTFGPLSLTINNHLRTVQNRNFIVPICEVAVNLLAV